MILTIEEVFMINRHQFQQAAKKFRGGRITLADFTETVFKESQDNPASQADGLANENAQGNPQTAQLQASVQVSQGNELSRALSREMGLHLRVRPSEAHKGDFGRVLAIGGSAGMSGAISLTGLASLRSGSGLVRVAVPEIIQALVAATNPCLMTIGCPAEGDVFHGASEGALAHHAQWADVVALGPGMGRGEPQKWIVKKLYHEIQQPMVVDADGLNTLSDAEVELADHQGQRILTPHPGEFRRLIGTKLTSRDELESAAIELAANTGVVVVLKGKGTLVTDGKQSFRNQTGNPGMATAGSGDVLTGVITSLVGQGLPAYDACCVGVNVHGVAGDLAAESVGETSLIATDIIECLPVAFKKLANASSSKIGFVS